VQSLDIGAVVNRVFAIYVDQAPVLMPAAAVVFVVTGVLSEVLIRASPALALVSIVVTIVAATLFTGMVVELVADVRDGRRDASVGRLLAAAAPVMWNLIALGIVEGIAILVGLVLLIVPGLILTTIWSVAPPAVVLERAGPIAALGRSRELVRGNGWQVFGVIALFVFGVLIGASVLDSLAAAAGTAAGIVVRVVVGVLTAPLSALAAAVLYFELGGSRARPLAGEVPPGAI
jgi:Uncharacterised protein family (UPF0259)